MADKEKLRIDKYLWAIRIFKTRSMAAEACLSSKVKSKGVNIKPSKPVSVGDHYEIKTEHKKWVIEVVSLIHNRVGYEEAIKNYIDLTPAEDINVIKSSAFVFNTGKRKSKQGRPTKKHKRDLDDLFGD